MATIDKAVIIGGGVSGLTAAVALQRRGVEVEVHERYDHLQGRATGFTIWSYAVGHLVELGVDEAHLERIGYPLQVTELRNHHGRLLEKLPLGKAGEQLGHPCYEVDRADLQRALMDLLADGTVRMGSEATAIDPQTGTVTLAGGATTSGDLVLGSDGIHAISRDAAAGGGELHYSGYAAWGAVTELTHSDLGEAHHVELWGPGHKAGVGDVGNGRARWYVTGHSEAGDTSRTKEELRASVDGWYPLILAAIDATPEEAIVRSEGWWLSPLQTWVNGRLVLLGDAAHATLAFGSNGACMAIDDVRALVWRLDGEPNLATALAGYEQDRKAYTEGQVRRAKRMGHLAQLHQPAGWARDAFLAHVPADKVEEIARDMAAGT